MLFMYPEESKENLRGKSKKEKKCAVQRPILKIRKASENSFKIHILD